MNDFIEKNLMDLSEYFRRVYFSCDFSSRKGFVQRMNPQVAFTGIMAFIALSVYIREIYILFLLYSISIILIILSKIPLKFYLNSMAFIPFFTALIAIPYIFYPFSSPPFLLKFSILSFSSGITYCGLLFSAILFLRVLTAVSFMILITYGVGFQKLIRSLKSLKFPDILLNILSFTYRYIFLVTSQVYDILLSRKSRICTRNVKVARKWQSYILGYIFFRSHFLGENTYFSMVSRGYTGEIQGRKNKLQIGYTDISLLLLFIFISLIVVCGW